MGISEQHFHFRWKIQARPEGGFSAVSDDPADTIEGATREEVEAKIKQRIAAALGPEIAEKIQFGEPGQPPAMHVTKKFTISLGSPVQRPTTPTLMQSDVPTPPPPIDAGGGSMLTALWKVAVLIGIAIVIWLLLRR